jgi:dolichyl-phosphate beta-glucosyltransferase
MSEPLLTIIFPAYNEGAAVKTALRSARDYVAQRGLDAEILLVNDGSRDDTEQQALEVAADDPRVRVISHHPNGGKGYAVKQGMLAARGKYRAFLDVDLATPVDAVDLALPLLEAGADVVLGSRHLPASVIEVPQGFLRRFMGGWFRRIAGRMLGLGVTDITCGFKALRGDVAQELFGVQHETGWAFDAELIYVARRWGLRVSEVPVRWRDSGDSRVRPGAAALESLRELARVRRRGREGAYERGAR